MAKQLNAYPTKDSIGNIVGKIKRNEWILQPEFQRKFVWTPKHMESFVQTILDGYPFPEIYISQRGIDIETLATQNVVVDGQQRLTTILKYVEGNGGFEKNIKKFKDLSEDEKKDFINYDITIRDLKDTPKEQIIEIFNRINSTKFTLNAIEINNALYNGEFINTAKDILEELLTNQYKFKTISDTEISRMGDLSFILLVMATIEEGGYFTYDNEVEKYIAKYNDEYENAIYIKAKIVTVLIEISNSNIPFDSIWFRKSNFFTLVVEIIKNELRIADFEQKLIRFSENVLNHKKGDSQNNDFAKYYDVMYTGTNSRNSRVIRSELFQKYIL